MKSLENLSLKGRALRLLSAREHSRAELQRKLNPHAKDEQELSELLDELVRKGFLRDERVVESVIHQKASRHGAQRVIHELIRKGLSSELIDKAAADLQSTELERAWAVWVRKFGQSPADAAEKSRQMRFLASRGFSQEAIRKIFELSRQGMSPEVLATAR